MIFENNIKYYSNSAESSQNTLEWQFKLITTTERQWEYFFKNHTLKVYTEVMWSLKVKYSLVKIFELFPFFSVL